jgi:hypothetical protein
VVVPFGSGFGGVGLFFGWWLGCSRARLVLGFFGWRLVRAQVSIKSQIKSQIKVKGQVKPMVKSRRLRRGRSALSGN